MKFARWDDYLIAEHEMIERSMAVLKDCLEDLARTAENPVQLKRAIDFLLEFGDKMHNKKEEDYLFPLMQERGIPTAGGPIGVMLMEHEMERALLAEMAAKAPALADLSAAGQQDFRKKGLDYLRIRAEHIWKENDVLYPMARKVMNDADSGRLLAAFEKLDYETYGGNAHALYLHMVEEVEAGSGAGGRRLIRNLSYEQLDAIMEAMPFEVTFVDAEDTVAYFNRLDREKLFPRTRSVIGRKVQKCHPPRSVNVVEQIVEGFKNKTRDQAEFWIDFRGEKVLIRYFPVYGREGEYLGVLELTQAVGGIMKLTGEKRLLD